MLPTIFLYFSPFVGRIVVSKIFKKFRKFDKRILREEESKKHLPFAISL